MSASFGSTTPAELPILPSFIRSICFSVPIAPRSLRSDALCTRGSGIIARAGDRRCGISGCYIPLSDSGRSELARATPMNLTKVFLLVVSALLPLASLCAEERPSASSDETTARVAFTQYCFWTGEMKLGQIDGVVRTEAGFFQGREVTLVDYIPSRVSLDELARKARQDGVADSVHLPAGSKRMAVSAPVRAGVPLDQSYRPAPAGDQKKQMQGTPFARLKLTPEHATKVNAFARENPRKALEWLSPAQREQLKGGR